MPRDLRFQAVHADDVGEAYRLAAVSSVRGAFNLAAEPVVDAAVLADLLRTRVVTVPRAAGRAALSAAWLAHLVPTDPQLLDLFLDLPLLIPPGRAPSWAGSPVTRRSPPCARPSPAWPPAPAAPTAPLTPDSLAGRAHKVSTGIGERP